jgi:hypothetical protein
VTCQPKPNYRLAKTLFIRKANSSFGYTQHPALQCASLGGETTATRGDVKEGFWSISWYFLVKWCTTLPCERVEEDLLFSICSIYIEEFFVGFSPP